MAQYWQFRAKHPEHKLLYYICGREYSLVQEVKDSVVSQWGTNDVFRQDCASVNFDVIESTIMTQRPASIVHVIENAQLLSDLNWQVIEFAARRIIAGDLLGVVLVVVTNEDKPDTKQSRYRPFVEKGRFVECKSLNMDSLKRYCQEDYHLTPEATDLILERVSYDFRKLNNELEKLACLGLDVIPKQLVEDLVVFSASDLLLTHLLHNQPSRASMVTAVVDYRDTNYILGTLCRKLVFLCRMLSNDAPGMSAHRLAAKLGVKPWQLVEYFPLKRSWTSEDLLSHIRLITEIEKLYYYHRSNVLLLLVEWW